MNSTSYSIAPQTRPMKRVTHSTAGARGVYLLAALTVIDPILDQVNTAFAPRIGALSLLQAIRGLFLLFLGGATLWYLPRATKREANTVIAVLFVMGSLALFAIKESYQTGALSMDSVVAYLQIAYWLAIWQLSTYFCRKPRNARLLLFAIVAAAAISAFSVSYAWASGSTQSYEYQGIRASAAWFQTGKFVSGLLLVGAYVAVYLSRFGSRKTLLGISAACIGATVLTYVRAGLVAAVISLVWLFCWSAFFQRTKAPVRAWLLFALLACLALAFLAYVGTSDLQTRWGDLSDSASAGSGRVVFWQAGLDFFRDGNWDDSLTGVGYSRMLAELFRSQGIRIHTHSDVLDMLMIGGALGLMCLWVMGWSLLKDLRRLPLRSPEFGVTAAILLVLFVHGISTGQIFGPDAMAAYVMAVTCIGRIGTSSSRRTVRTETRFRNSIGASTLSSR